MFAAASATARPAAEPSEAARHGRPGDPGRRITRRRRELGLSVAEVAQRAGMTPGFLDWVETRPAELAPGELARLAAALGTTRRELLGGDRAPR
ncbi:hypothetical protein DN069_01925 [Streptacidiphilus pinicola]|uniref:HTH cro/C1-type domain-containing protein n=1 Tax=Streptacidiphilus pinicola TaxID=2219663 RepID=A0A2X0KK24_9ACTN|nr:helix-turn-helix transcriptional regulator [Streptacidiphilus pinicola]RAG87309.1 hypothetical protein DN069_01925 [Streptacidiphilus pinicola]